MMGVYIKGIEMPKDGCHHTICIYADGTVSTGGRVYIAVPVPPHGRLIDADAMLVGLDKRWHPTAQAANKMPTIIPADKEIE